MKTEKLLQQGFLKSYKNKTTTVQLNLGACCNQHCRHCHVNAGPNRTERMDTSVIDRVFDLIDRGSSVRTIDLTGGAPELFPLFKSVIKRAVAKGLEVIDRNNLTVLFEAGQEGLPAFLAEHKVHIIASLPCYTEDNVDAQRGDNTFAKSIRALTMLNVLGYGKAGSGLILDLVYNPGGADLPGDQGELDADYHRHLLREYGIVFNRLITITNVPIARFRSDLERSGEYEGYLELLADNFNENTLDSIMCRSLVSVGWDGKIYDCDFNQALKLQSSSEQTVFKIHSFDDLVGQQICFAPHCLACTAGAGSSCFGAVVKNIGAALSEAAV